MSVKYLFIPFFLFLALARLSAAAWNWDDPLPQGNALFAAAVSTGSSPVVVAVGEHGTVVRAVSSGTWTSHGPVADGLSLQGIVWSGDRFLAAGFSAGVWSSSDGRDWSLVDSSVRAARIFRAGSNVIALGSSTAWVSSGNKFTPQSLASAGISAYRDAASDGSRVLLYGSGGFLATTVDGKAWTKSPQDTASSFYSAGGGSTGFLVGGLDGNGNGILLSSANGSAWSAVTPPAGRFFPIRIFRLNDGWLVQDYYSGAFYRRGDSTAAVWARLESDLPGFFPAAFVSSSLPDRILFFGDRGLVAKLDGTKIVPELTGVIDSAYLYSPRFSAAAAGNVFAAIDANVASTRSVRYFSGISSPSGIAWRKPVPAPVRGLTALAAVGTSTIVGYSGGAPGAAAENLPATDAGFYRTSDGLSWQVFGRAEDENGIDLLQGQVVSIASRPDESATVVLTRSDLSSPAGYSAVRSVYRTTNWSDWQQISLPVFRANPPASEENIESVVWDGSQFVMLLHPGRVFTSADGLAWKQLPSLPPGLGAVSVASGSGIFVARTAALQSDGSYAAESSGGEKICVFKDGRWWSRDTGRRAPVLQRRIIFAQDTFVASGQGSEVLTSTDGFSWRAHSAPGAPFALLWNGSRLAAFNDSFAAFSLEGLPSGGTALALAELSTRSRSVPAAGETYNISLAIAEGKDWSVSKIPSWMTVSPSSGRGPAQLAVIVSANTGKSLRGTVLDIGGESHFVLQRLAEVSVVAPVSGSASTVKIPFAGEWNIASEPGIVSLPNGATGGQGTISLAVARNDSAASRTVTVDINGVPFVLTQLGTPLPVLRAGSYSGLVGYLPDGVSPDALDNYQSAFEGFLRVVVAPPAKNSPQGGYSAQLTLHDGTKPVVFRGSGPFDADGSVAEARWSAGPKGPSIVIKRMAVVRDEEKGQHLEGEFSNAGFRFGFLAGRNIFSAKSNPLSSDYARPATFFLTKYGESGSSADSGVGAVKLGADGIARLSGVLVDGTKFTAASSVWGEVEARMVLPFSFAAGSARIVCGFSRFDSSSLFTDWDGLAALVKPGKNQSGQAETDLGFLSASLCIYTPAPKGSSPFSWTLDPALRLALASGGLEGEVSSPSPGKIAADLPGSAKMSLSFAPATGLVKGSFTASPGAAPVTLIGALTQKQYNISGDIGGFLGMVLGPQPGTFEILPQ